MDLRHLAALVAVADRGTFSAAATALHTVQSNVSTHVARLERELSATLFDRSAGRLTEEGEVVVARARRAAAEVDAISSDLAAQREYVTGTVRLGVIGSTARWLVIHLVDALRDLHPGVRLVITEGGTTNLVPPLTAGRLDQAVVNLPLTEADVATEALFDEDLLLIVPDDHPMAGADGVYLADLEGLELLLPAPGTALRTELDHAASVAGVQLTAMAEIDGIRLLGTLGFEGYGPTVLPATTAPSWLEGPWRRIRLLDTPRRSVGLAVRRRELPSAASRAVQDILHGVVVAQLGHQPGIHSPEPAR
ncbi:MAG TPA: LysR family transcriptional regulator [Acidimicrobiales bacterium]|jgi:LysR family hydrogen peroxide-inducible transcriptional activator